MKSVASSKDAQVIALVGLAHGASHFGHLLLAPLFPIWAKEFQLSFAQLGSLMTIFFMVSALGQALSGSFVDKYGAQRILFGAVFLFVLASALAGIAGFWSSPYSGLMAAAVCAGLANASFHPVDFGILNHSVSAPRLGHAFSVHGLSGSLGWALAPVFLVGLTEMNLFALGWRGAYLGAALFFLTVLALLYSQRRCLTSSIATHPHPQKEDQALRPQQPYSFLRQAVVWWCFAFFFFSTITLSVVQNFVPSILHFWYGLSAKAAASVVSLYMVMSACGGLLGGFVVARWATQSERVVAVCLAFSAMFLLLIAAHFLPQSVTVVLLAVTGFAMGVAGPSRDMTIKRATPHGATGRVYGTVYSGLDLGLASAPLVFGVFMDKGWYSMTLMGAAASLLLGIFATQMVRRNL